VFTDGLTTSGSVGYSDNVTCHLKQARKEAQAHYWHFSAKNVSEPVN
jgi:hypothetical protein